MDMLNHTYTYTYIYVYTYSRNYVDTRNFDREFTNMKPKESVEEETKYSTARRRKKWNSSDNLVEYENFSFRSSSFLG